MSEYDKENLKKCGDIYNALYYYKTKVEELENENKYLKEMYEKRVNEYLELKKKVGDIE